MTQTLPNLSSDPLRSGRALGVIIVSYCSKDVVLDCLESLLATTGQPLRIMVVDNASPDETPSRLHAWANGSQPAPYTPGLPYERTSHGPVQMVDLPEGSPPPTGAIGLTVLSENRGFAGGVNAGLAALAADPDVVAFWILNPDAMTAAQTPTRLMEAAERPGWGLLGGRIYYADESGSRVIQCDSGIIDRRRGVCRLLHQFRQDEPELPEHIDYVAGAHLVISRAMLAETGGMLEDYFLYWEEIDLAVRRGDLTIGLVPDAPVYHYSGTSIGSSAPGRGAGAMSAWFNTRGALRFQQRHAPHSLPTTWLWQFVRAARAATRGHWAAAYGQLRAILGMGPPAEVYRRLTPASLKLALAPAQLDIRRGPIPADLALLKAVDDD